eukprot:g2730.t1
MSSKTDDDEKKEKNSVKQSKKPIKLLRGALRRNELFSSLYLENSDDSSIATEHKLVSSFDRYEVKNGESLCIQGQENNFFYIVERGHFDVLVKEDVRVPTRYGMISKIKVRRIASVGTGNSFGERAILENTKSGMTVRATSNSVVWRIKRGDVSKVLTSGNGSSKRNSIINSLSWRQRVSKEVSRHSFFQHLHQENIKVRLINSFFPVRFKKGETVIHQNALGDNFYIVDQGELDIYRVNSGSGSKLVHIQTLGPGDSVGELAIKFPNRISDVKVKAKTDVSLLAMERSKFQELSRTGAHVLYARFKSYSSSKDDRGEPLMTIDDFLQCQEDGIVAGNSNDYVSPENRGSTNNLLKMLFRVAAHHSSKGERRYIDFNSYYHLNVLMHKSNSEYEIAFKIMDYDNNGRIDRNELELLLSTILRSRNMPADAARVKDLVNNTVPESVWRGRGYLTYEDFCELIRLRQVPYLIDDMCRKIRDEADSWYWQNNMHGTNKDTKKIGDAEQSNRFNNEQTRKTKIRRIVRHGIDFFTAGLASIIGSFFINPFSLNQKASMTSESIRYFVDHPSNVNRIFSYSLRCGFVRATQFSLLAYASSKWGENTSLETYVGTLAICGIGGAGADVLARPTTYLNATGTGARAALLSVGPRWAIHFACFGALKSAVGYRGVFTDATSSKRGNIELNTDSTYKLQNIGLLGVCGVTASIAGTTFVYPFFSIFTGNNTLSFKHFKTALFRTTPVVTTTLMGVTLFADYFKNARMQNKKKVQNQPAF